MSDPLLRRAARDMDAIGALTPECIEADTAAAWADGSLAAGERTALLTHAAGCARCRALLAALVRTEPPGVTAPLPWWKTPLLRWAAPLAAVTGALLVWVAVGRGPVDSRAPAGPPPAPAIAEQEARSEPTAKAAPPAEATPLGDTASPKRRAPQATATPSAPTAPSAAAAEKDTRSAADAVARQRAEKPVAAPPAAVSESLRVMSGRASQFVPALEVVAPDGSTRWRVTEPGAVERSNDGGATWERQALDTKVPLVAGSSPASETCWLAGAAGTVLRTTDGRTWRRVSIPDPADLAAISAKDADIATVTTADGRTFRTTDGGVTWSR
jgi:hypothetical protein